MESFEILFSFNDLLELCATPFNEEFEIMPLQKQWGCPFVKGVCGNTNRNVRCTMNVHSEIYEMDFNKTIISQHHSTSSWWVQQLDGCRSGTPSWRNTSLQRVVNKERCN